MVHYTTKPNRRGSRFQDLVGMKFGRLTVVEEAARCVKSTRWLCRCECGQMTDVTAHHLRRGDVRSCGCLRNEALGRRSFRHGMSGHALHRIYRHVVARCENKNDRAWSNYGGRGIAVCDEWRRDRTAFFRWAFDHGYREGLELDRINNNEGYSPQNCRFTDRITQANNKRTNRRVTAFNETKTVAEWARDARAAMPMQVIWARLMEQGWSPEDAISKPNQKPRRKRICPAPKPT